MTPALAPAHNAFPRRILLVEDEESLRSLLTLFLSRAGYDVMAAGAGEEAVRIFTGEPDRFAAAIVDLTLPDMSGEALLTRLRAFRPDLPVVVSSGTARTTAQFAHGAAPVRFLQKPFLPSRLGEALAEMLPAQSSSESSAS